jgi:hypothetical protein
MRVGEYLVPSTRMAKKGAEYVKKYIAKKKAKEDKEKTSKEKTKPKYKEIHPVLTRLGVTKRTK